MVVISAKVFPLNQLTSKMDIMWNGKFTAALSRSTTARLPTRMFGTVRNDLKRARTPKTKPVPNTEHDVRTTVNMFMTTLVKRGFAGYILRCNMRVKRNHLESEYQYIIRPWRLQLVCIRGSASFLLDKLIRGQS